jgi:hypothetical protein
VDPGARQGQTSLGKRIWNQDDSLSCTWPLFRAVSTSDRTARDALAQERKQSRSAGLCAMLLKNKDSYDEKNGCIFDCDNSW